MAAITADRTGAEPGPARGRRAGLAGALRSELTKLRSVRSTYWSLLLLVLAGIAWAVADCAGVAAHWPQTPPRQRGFLDADPGQRGRAGPARPAHRRGAGRARDHVGVLDRDDPHLADRAAAPRRGIRAPRPIVVTAVTLVIARRPASPRSSSASTCCAARIRPRHSASRTCCAPCWPLPCTSRCPACSASASARCCAARRAPSPPPIGAAVPRPAAGQGAAQPWYADVVRWLPGGDVTNAITSTERQLPQHLFSAWGEFAVFGGYTAIMLVAGALLLRRRDA